MSDLLFLKATREKWRWESSKGQLTVENLWDLPLSSKRDDIVTLSKLRWGLRIKLKAFEAEAGDDFGEETTIAAQDAELCRQKIAVIEAIAAVLQQERDIASSAAVRRQEISRLEKLLAEKQDAALQALTEEQLTERLKALRGV